MRAAQRSGETNQGALLLRLQGDWEGLGHAWEHQCQGPGRLDREANGGMLRSKTCSLGPPELGIVWFICQVGLSGEHNTHEGGTGSGEEDSQHLLLIPGLTLWLFVKMQELQISSGERDGRKTRFSSWCKSLLLTGLWATTPRCW